MPMIRCRANASFSGAGQDVTHGEIVTVDQASWAPWIEAGFLTPLEPEPFGPDNPRVENDGSLDTSGSDGWPDGPIVETSAENYAHHGDGVKFGIPTSLDIEQGPPSEDAPAVEQPEG